MSLFTRSLLAQLLSRHYAPWADPYLRWAISPLGVLAGFALAALMCGLFVASQGLALAAALAAIMLLGVAWPWIGLKGVSCELQFRRTRATEGDRVTAVLVLRNRWPWPVWGLSVQRGFFPASDDGDFTAVALARIGAWTRGEFEWKFVPPSRGLYPKEQPLLSTEFPFGVWKAKSPVNVPNRIVIWPRTFRLSDLQLPSGDRLRLTEACEHREGHEGERLGARPFRIGDRLRDIHWILTARHDRFIVSQRQETAQSNATVILDLDPLIHSGPDPNGTLEWAIRIGASVCESFLQRGIPVQLRAAGEELACRPGALATRRLMDFLARLDPATDQQATLVDHRANRFGPPCFTVVVTTDRADPSRRLAHSIVLCVGGFPDAAQNCPAPIVPAWIHVPAAQDVAAAVASAWAANSEEVWRGR